MTCTHASIPSHMIHVRELGDTTHVWMDHDGQTLASASLPTSDAWQPVPHNGGVQWFQTLALLDAAIGMAAEHFGVATPHLEWLGKGWKTYAH